MMEKWETKFFELLDSLGFEKEIQKDAWGYNLELPSIKLFPDPYGNGIYARATYAYTHSLVTREEMQKVMDLMLEFFDYHGDEKVAAAKESDERWAVLYPKEWELIKVELRNPPHTIQEFFQQQEDHSGEVYLLRADNGVCKIGRSKRADNRIKYLACSLPYELEVVCIIETENMVALESELHERFADKRLGRPRSEWFALEVEDIEYIKGLADGR